MFNIGLIELLIIVFFSLILVKPQDFPRIANHIGLFYRKINRYFFNLKHDFSNFELDESGKEIKAKKQKNKKWAILSILRS